MSNIHSPVAFPQEEERMTPADDLPARDEARLLWKQAGWNTSDFPPTEHELACVVTLIALARAERDAEVERWKVALAALTLKAANQFSEIERLKESIRLYSGNGAAAIMEVVALKRDLAQRDSLITELKEGENILHGALDRAEARVKELEEQVANWVPTGDGEWTNEQWLRNQLLMANECADVVQTERDTFQARVEELERQLEIAEHDSVRQSQLYSEYTEEWAKERDTLQAQLDSIKKEKEDGDVRQGTDTGK